MANKVRYNGGCNAGGYDGQSDPKNLTVGQEYEVCCETTDCKGMTVVYQLDGINGQYPASCFDVINFYMAVGTYLPIIGEKYICRKVDIFKRETVFSDEIITSEVRETENIGGKLFKITTCDSVYIVDIC